MKSFLLVFFGAIVTAAHECMSALDGKLLDLSHSPALINDDFCDCLDGSDEPATSACSYLTNAMHECYNHGLITTSIHTGQVNDGICDCCDGSDEPLGICQDTCQAVIESKRLLIQKQLDTVNAGYAERNKRLEALQQADIDKKVQIKAKQSFVQELKQLAQKVTVFKDKEERTEFAMRVEAAKNKEDDNKCAVDAKEESITDEPPVSTTSVSDDVVELTQAQAKTKLSLTVNRLDGRKMSLSAYMHDVLDQAKRIPIRSVHQRRKEDFLGPLFNGDHKDRVRILTYGLQGIGLILSPVRGVYEVIHFISSKTMDLAHALMPQFIYDPWQTFLELLELDWSYHKSIALRRLSQGQFFWWRYYASWIFDTIWDAPVEVVWETFFPTLDTSVALPEAESLRDILTEIQSDITALEQEIDRLERVETVEFGQDEGFQILKGACALAQIEKYFYKICPFGQATQDNVRLGTWKAWSSYSPPVMSFEGGQKCWNGPERSVQLKLECGVHDEIVSVDELSTCVYTVVMKTPAACTSSLVQSAQAEAKKWLISD
uniref:Glucosidase 2 subunit beta n=1 Tax=Thraustotheca clavata TaxID=74557 RepID=A0A0A7CM39_9STRA|nr:secreted protein [Thraustotheca clavata]